MGATRQTSNRLPRRNPQAARLPPGDFLWNIIDVTRPAANEEVARLSENYGPDAFRFHTNGQDFAFTERFLAKDGTYCDQSEMMERNEFQSEMAACQARYLVSARTDFVAVSASLWTDLSYTTAVSGPVLNRSFNGSAAAPKEATTLPNGTVIIKGVKPLTDKQMAKVEFDSYVRNHKPFTPDGSEDVSFPFSGSKGQSFESLAGSTPLISTSVIPKASFKEVAKPLVLPPTAPSSNSHFFSENVRSITLDTKGPSFQQLTAPDQPYMSLYPR